MAEHFLKTPPASAREKIVIAAFDLFHERGIHATSVDDILKASNTGKSQFYHYFGSKDGLVSAMLEVAHHKIKNAEILGLKDFENWQDLEDWFEDMIEKMSYYEFYRSCPMGRFVAELSQDDEHIRTAIKLVFEAKKQYPKELFIKMKARGELKPDADADAMADFVMALMQGASLMGKMNRDPAAMRKTFAQGLHFLKSFAV